MKNDEYKVITPFGEAVRSLRREHRILLKEMADELEIWPSYISSVETGKKPLGDAFVERVVSFFESRGIAAEHLYDAAARSKTSLTIDLENVSGEQRQVAVALARRLPDLTDQQRKRMWRILAGG